MRGFVLRMVRGNEGEPLLLVFMDWDLIICSPGIILIIETYIYRRPCPKGVEVRARECTRYIEEMACAVDILFWAGNFVWRFVWS